ncbi:LPS export ABC transporter permease LptF [Magnetospirillum sulfuroxidans]|uniref:LPS export ABC transporter permease LptF n=1 Tax=Magnetospirillum sulfuroxidans TaxID=611300 RepID=A0ABS5IHP9_9PROT|nr:LPS export ABC transporter permease LptF [Magnetospirillum sulfuroxidans]MBR9973283.1 LPS export ABC transporter permease LptF [Magnetospirillum sulfuroxidans]
MKGITRYFLRQLAVGMLFVSVALTCVLWLTQSLRLIEMIVTQGISVGTFLRLTGMLMPTFLVVIIPIALFAVILFTYNKLNSDRELVVLRAAGLSNWTLAKPALILAAAATLVGYALSLWIIPLTVQSFRELQWSIRNDISNVLLQEGTFNKFGNGLTIYVRARNAEGELLGILVHDKRTPSKPVTLMAERGALVFTENGPRILMVNGNRQQLPEGTGQLSVLNFDSYTVDLSTANGGGGDRFRDARERSLGELINASEEEMGSTDFRRAKVELHQRLTSPVYSLGYALIALATLLSASFDRRGQTVTILTAIALMVGVQAAALGLANLASAKPIFLPFLYVLAILPLIAGPWVLIHPPRHNPLRRKFAAQAA